MPELIIGVGRAGEGELLCHIRLGQVCGFADGAEILKEGLLKVGHKISPLKNIL